MLRVFLSYAHADHKVAEALEESLRRRSIESWRDKTSLHAGDRWPKALGEAIRQADALLLLWSEAASRSDFVELEWNIALALKKPVLPVLSDETALPAALSASHGIKEVDLQRVVERMDAALKAAASAPVEPAKGHDAIITRLANLTQRDPRAVLESVKVLIQQPGWTVGGAVYQAGGDIHIHGDSQKKSLADRWKVWVGIAVGVLTAGILLKQLAFDKIPGTARTPSTEVSAPSPAVPSVQPTVTPVPVSQEISGIITDEFDNPIQGATVTLIGFSDSTITEAGGRFSLPVRGALHERVRLSVTKDGFRPLSEYYPVRQDVRVMLRRE